MNLAKEVRADGLAFVNRFELLHYGWGSSPFIHSDGKTTGDASAECPIELSHQREASPRSGVTDRRLRRSSSNGSWVT